MHEVLESVAVVAAEAAARGWRQRGGGIGHAVIAQSGGDRVRCGGRGGGGGGRKKPVKYAVESRTLRLFPPKVKYINRTSQRVSVL